MRTLPPPPPPLTRFTAAERRVHRATGALMGVCLLTAFALYYGPVALMVGHRRVVELLHVVAGYALPVPTLVGLASRAFRDDLGRLDRFTAQDWRWLRSRSRRDGRIRVGKFNAGQKLNACLSAGATLVLLGTGTVLLFPEGFRLAWRTGATFAHDWFALALGLLALGHTWMAMNDPDAREGMRHGLVTRRWAERHHAAWADEMADEMADEKADADEDEEPLHPRG